MMKCAAFLFAMLFGCVSAAVAEDVDISSLKTFSSIGKEQGVLNGYKEAELLQHKGRGCLTHMWFGGDWPGFNATRIRIYIDGETHASIDMELGLGHGVGFADQTAPWGSEKLGKTGQPSGLYNTYKIPFRKDIRVTAQRATNSPDGAPFWWIMRGADNLRPTIAGATLPKRARLRMYKVENHLARPLEEFALCNVHGAGALYQVTIAAEGMGKTTDWTSLSFLEAIMRAYIDGAKEPTQLSSGLEDYFLGTYYFNRGRYANGLAGLTHFDAKNTTFSAYRFHDDDPVVFKKGLRLTCRCGEQVDGRTIGNPPETLFTSYVWVYQW